MASQKGKWKVYIYGVPMRLNDPVVRRYVYLSSARAAVKRFVSQGKNAMVADDPAEERLELQNPGPASIRAQVRRLPSGQIQLKIPIGRSENPQSVIAQLKKVFGKRVKAVEMTGERKRNPRPFYTIQKSDVGKATIKAFGKRWRVDEFIGHIGAYDVGKRVVQPIPGVLQVENDQQLQKRLGTRNPGAKQYWQYPWVVLLKDQHTNAVNSLTEHLCRGYDTEREARSYLRKLQSAAVGRGRTIELVRNTKVA